MKTYRTMLLAAALLIPLTAPAAADEAARAAVLGDIEETLGFVPTVMAQMPSAGLGGAWAQLRDLEFNENTALPPKVKFLIALGVNAQIPCQYCVWAAAAAARSAGASDEEIGEAVAIAATERYWSTMLHGLQIDLATFKAEFGPLVGE